MAFRCLQFFLLSALAAPLSLAADTGHNHKPIQVRSRPVIERLPLRVIEPVDVVVNGLGETLVADRIGKVVFRVDAEHETSVMGQNLEGLTRIADSRSFGLHALISGKKTGAIIRLLETGFQEIVCETAFEPAGLAADPTGNLWTTNPTTGEVILFASDGRQQKSIKLFGQPVDVAADAVGATVLLDSGEIVSVAADGGKKTIGYVTPAARRLQLKSDGSVIALATDSNGKSILVRPTATRGPVDRFAGTPNGTLAFAFDKLGNLTLANPDLRAITRVTSHFTVPCPHCGQPVPMVLSPTAPVQEKPTRRSF